MCRGKNTTANPSIADPTKIPSRSCESCAAIRGAISRGIAATTGAHQRGGFTRIQSQALVGIAHARIAIAAVVTTNAKTRSPTRPLRSAKFVSSGTPVAIATRRTIAISCRTSVGLVTTLPTWEEVPTTVVRRSLKAAVR
jgi:hypothetical protein